MDLRRFEIAITMKPLTEMTGLNEEWLQNFHIRIRNAGKKERFLEKGAEIYAKT
jgi:hypothetical protein